MESLQVGLAAREATWMKKKTAPPPGRDPPIGVYFHLLFTLQTTCSLFTQLNECTCHENILLTSILNVVHLKDRLLKGILFLLCLVFFYFHSLSFQMPKTSKVSNPSVFVDWEIIKSRLCSNKFNATKKSSALYTQELFQSTKAKV